RPLVTLRHLLDGRGGAAKGRRGAAPGPNGPRLRVGDVDDPATGAATRRGGREAGSRRAIRPLVRAGPPSVDHAGPERPRAHRLSAIRDRGEGGGPFRIVRAGRRGTPEARRRMGRSGVGRMSRPHGLSWKWWVGGALLLATMLNYMDRQTLSLTTTQLKGEINLDDDRYGKLEEWFSYAFAAGGIFFGLIADRVGPRRLYPVVLIGWSLAGIASPLANWPP